MSQFVVRRNRCLHRECWGARCTFCNAWVTKHDFTPEDALACAEAPPLHVCRAGSERALTDRNEGVAMRALGALRGDTHITAATERDQTEEDERL